MCKKKIKKNDAKVVVNEGALNALIAYVDIVEDVFQGDVRAPHVELSGETFKKVHVEIPNLLKALPDGYELEDAVPLSREIDDALRDEKKWLTKILKEHGWVKKTATDAAA